MQSVEPSDSLGDAEISGRSGPRVGSAQDAPNRRAGRSFPCPARPISTRDAPARVFRRVSGIQSTIDNRQSTIDNAAMSVIAVDALSKRYGRRSGVESLTLTVPSGAMYGFLGPNGSGKTTTIRMLMGLLRPTSGVGRVMGWDCWRESAALKAEVGYLPGDLRLPPWFTCREALRIFGRVRRRDLCAFGLELAEEFGLDPNTPVKVLSRGTRQKVGLILALAHRPKLLILDEPTAALDPLMQMRLYARLRQAVSAGQTVLLSSHTLSEIEELCTHAAILRAGRLVADGTMAELRCRARRRVTIRWRSHQDAPRPPSPDGVEWIERGPQQWRGVFRGSADPIVHWLALQSVEDVAIENPDLREVFQSFYARDDA